MDSVRNETRHDTIDTVPLGCYTEKLQVLPTNNEFLRYDHFCIQRGEKCMYKNDTDLQHAQAATIYRQCSTCHAFPFGITGEWIQVGKSFQETDEDDVYYLFHCNKSWKLSKHIHSRQSDQQRCFNLLGLQCFGLCVVDCHVLS